MTRPLTLQVAPEYDALAAGRAHELRASVRLAAGELQVEGERAPMTVIFALDVSTSMSGEPLAHVLAATRRMLEYLGPEDRVGVVTFSDAASSLAPAARLDRDHRALVLERLRGVEVIGGTSISAGLEQAARMMPARQRHERQLVLLLSDGVPNIGLCAPEALAGLVDMWWPELSVATLGFGAYHSDQVLSAISGAGGGTYHYIADPMLCEAEFGAALGTQQAMVADQVEVTLTPREGVELLDVRGGRRPRVSSRGYRLRVSDMPARAQRVLSVTLSVDAGLERGEVALFDVAVTYHGAREDEVETLRDTCQVRLARDTGEPDVEVVAEAIILRADEVREEAREAFSRGLRGEAISAIDALFAEIDDAFEGGFQEDSVIAEVHALLAEERGLFERGDRETHMQFRRYNTEHLYDSSTSSQAYSVFGPGGQARGALVLLVRDGEHGERFVELQDQSVIGRARQADLRLEHESVSRRHAEVVPISGGWVLRDLGSRNGTSVNGEELHGARLLQRQDLVYLGEVQVRVFACGE